MEKESGQLDFYYLEILLVKLREPICISEKLFKKLNEKEGKNRKQNCLQVSLLFLTSGIKVVIIPGNVDIIWVCMGKALLLDKISV